MPKLVNTSGMNCILLLLFFAVCMLCMVWEFSVCICQNQNKTAVLLNAHCILTTILSTM